MDVLRLHAGDLSSAILLTVQLFVGSLIIGTVTGLFVGIARNSSVFILYLLATIYSWFWRVLPVLLVLYFVFYGLPNVNIVLSSMTAGLLTIGLSSGAYIGEVVRGGLTSVPVGQREASATLGIGRMRTFRRIVLPYVVRSSAGPYISQSIMVLKGTSLASVIGVSELTQVTRGLISQTYQVWPFLLFSAATYLAISLILTFAQRKVEQRWSW